MVSTLQAASDLLDSLLSFIVDIFSLPYMQLLILLIVCGYVITLFRRLTT